MTRSLVLKMACGIGTELQPLKARIEDGWVTPQGQSINMYRNGDQVLEEVLL